MWIVTVFVATSSNTDRGYLQECVLVWIVTVLVATSSNTDRGLFTRVCASVDSYCIGSDFL